MRSSSNIKIPFGMKAGRLWHVADVPNGNACGCVCPQCKTPLQARNNPNNKRQPYFAHTQSVDCSYNGMTDLHVIAQQIIAEYKYLVVPEYRSSTPRLRLMDDSYVYADEVVIASSRVTAESVDTEYRWNEFVPDLRLNVQGKDLFVEIAVTHFSDERKIASVKAHDVAMLEIDLSQISPEIVRSKPALITEVLHPGIRGSWINNPKGNRLTKQVLSELEEVRKEKNEAILASRERKRRKEQRKKEEQEHIEKIRSHRRDEIAQDLKHLAQTQDDAWIENRERQLFQSIVDTREIRSFKRRTPPARLIDVPVNNDWIINAHRSVWQLFVLEMFLANPTLGIHASDVKRKVVKKFGVIAFMERLNMLKQREKSIGRERNKGYQEYGCWFLDYAENKGIISPYLPVVRYLEVCKRSTLFSEESKSVYKFNFSSLEEGVHHLRQGLRKLEERKSERERVQQLHAERSVEADEKHKKAWEKHKEESRLELESRQESMIAADRRLYQEGNGRGTKCESCQLSCLESDVICPFCGASDFSERAISKEFLETAVYRYRSSTAPDKSLENAKDLNLESLKGYLAN